VFGNISHSHPSLIFAGRAGSQTLLFNPMRGSTLVSSTLAHKYCNRVTVANTLAYYDTAVKGFIVSAPEQQNFIWPYDYIGNRLECLPVTP
jgi:hypothetical protein